MKFACFLIFFFGTVVTATAQKSYFIYLQTETQVPFYVKMNDRIISSSSAGYLILSNLVDSTYRLSLGFPSAARTESRFEVKVSGKDRGFLIRSTDGSFRLQDLQTAAVIRPQNTAENNVSYQSRNDAFTQLLSKAANDPGLLFVQVAMKEQQPPVMNVPKNEVSPQVSTQTVANKEPSLPEPVKKDSIQKNPGLIAGTKPEDSSGSAAESLIQDRKNAFIHMADSMIVSGRKETITEPVIDSGRNVMKREGTIQEQESEIVHKRSQVKKYSESSTTEGFGLVYLDHGDTGTDTIRLVIPNQKFALKQPGQKEVESEDVLLEISRESNASKKTAGKTDTAAPDTCKSTATENDFFKLRRSMAGKTTDPAMVEEARKYFKTKCFSTEQIRNLSALFLTPSGKYDFFNAAFPHVTDKSQFGSLQSEFRDESYIKRFKTLVGE